MNSLHDLYLELAAADPADTSLCDRIKDEIELMELTGDLIDNGDVAPAIKVLTPLLEETKHTFERDGVTYYTRYPMRDGDYVMLPDNRFFGVETATHKDVRRTDVEIVTRIWELVPPYTIKPNQDLHIAHKYT